MYTKQLSYHLMERFVGRDYRKKRKITYLFYFQFVRITVELFLFQK